MDVAPRRVTAKDVARRAGVSQSTVSYVLNDTPNQTISAATRERVHQAAQDLGYTPSAAARALRRGSSETVLIVLPDAPIGENIALVIETVTEVLEPHGFTVVYRRQKDGHSLAALWHELMPAAIANMAAFPPGDEAAIREAGIPVVSSTLDTGDGPAMRMPQVTVGRVQVDHLVERGHRHLAFAASDDPQVAEFMTRRLAGVRGRCQALGLPEPLVVEVPLDAERAARAVGAMRDRAEPVTAVCAYNDDVAFAVLAGMRARGLQAPADLAVIGVDNITIAPFAVPPLTTVDIHADLVGADLGRLVLRLLKPELEVPEPAHESAVDLVVRAST